MEYRVGSPFTQVSIYKVRNGFVYQWLIEKGYRIEVATKYKSIESTLITSITQLQILDCLK